MNCVFAICLRNRFDEVKPRAGFELCPRGGKTLTMTTMLGKPFVGNYVGRGVRSRVCFLRHTAPDCGSQIGIILTSFSLFKTFGLLSQFISN